MTLAITKVRGLSLRDCDVLNAFRPELMIDILYAQCMRHNTTIQVLKGDFFLKGVVLQV